MNTGLNVIWHFCILLCVQCSKVHKLQLLTFLSNQIYFDDRIFPAMMAVCTLHSLSPVEPCSRHLSHLISSELDSGPYRIGSVEIRSDEWCERSFSVTVLRFFHTSLMHRGAAVQCNAFGKFQCESGDGGSVPCCAAPQHVRRAVPCRIRCERTFNVLLLNQLCVHVH